MVVPYKRFRDDGPFDTIVVGSGIGGLATAALLAKAAHQRVLVLERHYTAGGLTHVFHRPGFEWAVGVHYVGEVHERRAQARALFEYLTERRLNWHSMPDVYDRVLVDGIRFDYVRGRDRLREALLSTFPDEHRAIARYFDAVARCLRWLPLYFVEKALPPVPSRVFGGLLRAPFLSSAGQTTAAVIEDLGASPELKAVLTAQWGDYGLPPGRSSFAMHAVVTSHYFNGAGYPVGGAGSIAAGLLPTIEHAGGAVVVDAAVSTILLDHGRAVGVRMADGREFRASQIVSDAGARATLEHLLPVNSPPAVRRVVDRLSAIEPSTAHLCLYVGLDARRVRTPLDGTNLWVHPSLDFDRNLAEFERDLASPFPVVFISFPSANDPSFDTRHPGHAAIEVVTIVGYEPFARWAGTTWHHRGADYDALKQQLADRLLAELRHRVPAIEGAVTTWELSTPLSMQHFTAAAQGASYGLAHSPARFLSRDLRPRTPVGNLFLTGQDIGTCGVMGALSGAVTTASVVVGRNLFNVARTA